MNAVDHAGYERHELLGRQVRDIASRSEGELMAVTHEVHSDGRVVRIDHTQQADLVHALVRELDITVGDD
ncbi:hypothetical protein [Streptomyces sp. NPDC008122]|uniref:hypothetical protein n=1 Tax=Streptomyces sp. NPDC008122 TaxID=3364810 RepID=UPI0036EBDF42